MKATALTSADFGWCCHRRARAGLAEAAVGLRRAGWGSGRMRSAGCGCKATFCIRVTAVLTGFGLGMLGLAWLLLGPQFLMHALIAICAPT